jgi:hypothetical protein
VIIKNWLVNCRDGHQRCSKTPEAENWKDRSGPLPTRVLNVGVGNTVKLLASGEHTGHYVALSHCWGPPELPNRLVTNKLNLQSHSTEILLEKLPKTYRDAVLITRGIGIQYLWIDSLCIVQDDIEDWFREGCKMAEYYHGAFCTISAASTSDHQSGIFKERRSIWTLGLNFDRKERGTALLQDDGPYKQEALLSIRNGSLAKRGWCFQEYLLSRRLIHFTAECLAWECRSQFETEDYHPVTRMVPNMLSHVGQEEWQSFLSSANLLNDALKVVEQMGYLSLPA